MRSPCTATKSSPRSPQLEKAYAQQRRPNTAKKKEKKKKKKTKGEGKRKEERTIWNSDKVLHIVGHKHLDMSTVRNPTASPVSPPDNTTSHH